MPSLWWEVFGKIEIIGNVHENPELLEGNDRVS